MKRAHHRDAVHTEKYFFRKDVFRTRRRHHSRYANHGGPGTPRSSRAPSPSRGATGNVGEAPNGDATLGSGPQPAWRRTVNERNGEGSPGRSRAGSPELGPVEDEYEEFTMDELINGKVCSAHLCVAGV